MIPNLYGCLNKHPSSIKNRLVGTSRIFLHWWVYHDPFGPRFAFQRKVLALTDAWLLGQPALHGQMCNAFYVEMTGRRWNMSEVFFWGGRGRLFWTQVCIRHTPRILDDRGDMDYDAWVLSCALCRRFGKWDMQCIGWVWVWYEIQNAKWANECLKTSFLLSCEYLAKATGGFSKVSAIASTAYPAVALSLRAMWQNEALSALHLTDFQPGAQNETYKKYVHISELYGSI